MTAALDLGSHSAKRRKLALGIGVAAGVLAGTGGLAAAGVLPAPVQNAIATAVHPLGITIQRDPGGGTNAPRVAPPAVPVTSAGPSNPGNQGGQSAVTTSAGPPTEQQAGLPDNTTPGADGAAAGGNANANPNSAEGSAKTNGGGNVNANANPNSAEGSANSNGGGKANANGSGKGNSNGAGNGGAAKAPSSSPGATVTTGPKK